jgi:hypothetical protein
MSTPDDRRKRIENQRDELTDDTMTQVDTTLRTSTDQTDDRASSNASERRDRARHSTDAEPGISADVAFDVLRNARRRYVLYFLREDSPRELGELAEQIAARENDTTVEGLSSKQRKSVYTALYQTHLPKLADVGIIEYDRDRGVVWLADTADELDPYLNAHHDGGKWANYFLGLAIIGGVLVVANGLGIGPLTTVPSIAVVVALISGFIALSIVYAVRSG